MLPFRKWRISAKVTSHTSSSSNCHLIVTFLRRDEHTLPVRYFCLLKIAPYPSSLLFPAEKSAPNALFVHRLPDVLLDNPVPNNAAHDQIKPGILDARRLLKLCSRRNLRGYKLRARPERCKVAADSERRVQLKAIVLLLEQG